MKHLLFILLFSVLFSCKTTQNATQSPLKFAENPVVAHRGAWKTMNYPENSVAALKYAIELGCTGSEFDVWMTADDSLIVNHDSKYQGLAVEESTYNELVKFKLKNDEKLPTLREYLTAGMMNNSTTRLVLEIKPSDKGKARAQQIAEKTVNMVRGMNAKPWVVYISFDYDMLLKVKEVDPQANTQYLTGNKTPEQLKQDGIDGMDYHFNAFKKNPNWISEAKAKNLSLNAWTVNETEDIDRLLSQAFDYITTNEPELTFERLTLKSD
jgi:glycerophosphoryl diester phosphodiesterase